MASSSSSSSSSNVITSETCTYCYLDLDINNHRTKLGITAAFVNATNTRYGFSSKDLKQLGGSEISRIPELISMDHEWQSQQRDCGGIETKPPSATCGNRIVVRLYWDVAPLACENFATLCTNGSSILSTTNTSSSSSSSSSKTIVLPLPIGESGKPLTYRNSNIHRIIPGFILQGGDFIFGNGSGGESIFNNGKKFKDERLGLLLKHNRQGLLSMGNSGKNSNSSQFFFTLHENGASQCNGKHVIFGEVVSGMSILQTAELYGSGGGGGGRRNDNDNDDKVGGGSSSNNGDGTPTVPITITDCGSFHPLYTPGAGYWYDQPDSESYSGKSPIFIVRPRIVLIVPTKLVGEKFQMALIGQGQSSSSTVIAITHIISLDDLETNDNNDNNNNNKDDATKGSITAAAAAAAAQQVLQLLESFTVDVAVVAPACTAVQMALPQELPPSWKKALHRIQEAGGTDIPTTIGMDEIVLKVKPVEALTAIREQSWLAKRSNWQLDGMSS